MSRSLAFGLRRVALFRAPDDCAKSAERLAARGFEAVIAPVLEPMALQPPLPLGRFDAVVATSGKALDFAGPALLAALAGGPVHVVGATGEAAAARRGLSVAASAADAESLARILIAALPKGGRALYLAGADRKPDMESALIGAGFSLTIVEVYAARAREDWSAAERLAVASCGAALHYSRRSAELAARLAERAEIWSQWGAIAHVAISADAAEPLGPGGGKIVVVAPAPREDAMLAALEDLLGD